MRYCCYILWDSRRAAAGIELHFSWECCAYSRSPSDAVAEVVAQAVEAEVVEVVELVAVVGLALCQLVSRSQLPMQRFLPLEDPLR